MAKEEKSVTITSETVTELASKIKDIVTNLAGVSVNLDDYNISVTSGKEGVSIQASVKISLKQKAKK